MVKSSIEVIKQTGFDYDGAVMYVDWDGQTYIKKFIVRKMVYV